MTRNYSMKSGHQPLFDAVVTIGCGDACPWMPAKRFIDWEIADPKFLQPQAFNQVRDLLRNKVEALVDELVNEEDTRRSGSLIRMMDNLFTAFCFPKIKKRL